jgi:type IV secretion system protein VirB3
MFAGVTYSFFIANGVVATELFLVFKSFWALGGALLFHLAGVLLCLREPRIFDLWLIRVSRCPAFPTIKFGAATLTVHE